MRVNPYLIFKIISTYDEHGHELRRYGNIRQYGQGDINVITKLQNDLANLQKQSDELYDPAKPYIPYEPNKSPIYKYLHKKSYKKSEHLTLYNLDQFFDSKYKYANNYWEERNPNSCHETRDDDPDKCNMDIIEEFEHIKETIKALKDSSSTDYRTTGEYYVLQEIYKFLHDKGLSDKIPSVGQTYDQYIEEGFNSRKKNNSSGGKKNRRTKSKIFKKRRQTKKTKTNQK
jgi:hypothetical protein